MTFAIEDKLRTLLWQWSGEPLPEEALQVLENLEDGLGIDLDGPLGCALQPLLTRSEIASVVCSLPLDIAGFDAV